MFNEIDLHVSMDQMNYYGDKENTCYVCGMKEKGPPHTTEINKRHLIANVSRLERIFEFTGHIKILCSFRFSQCDKSRFLWQTHFSLQNFFMPAKSVRVNFKLKILIT